MNINKSIKITLIIIFFVCGLVMGLSWKNDTQNKEKEYNHKTKEFIFKNEQSFIKKADYISLYSADNIGINWATGCAVNDDYIDSYEAVLSLDKDDYSSEKFVLTENGNLYYYDGINYDMIEINHIIKNIGKYYYNSNAECEKQVLIIAEADDGNNYVVEFNYAKNTYDIMMSLDEYIAGIPDQILASLPECYQTTFNSFLQIDNSNRIKFYEKEIIKDSLTNKEIESELILFVSGKSSQKYYIVSKDSKLYIIDRVNTKIEAKTDIVDVYKEDNKVSIKINNNQVLDFNIND